MELLEDTGRPFDPSALDIVPMFPLPGIVLLPGAIVPLHVFEPRYRAMMTYCLDTPGDRLLTLAWIDGSRPESAAGPQVLPVMGVGRIVGHEALPDGRSNILVQGLARVRYEGEHASDHPFRLIHAASIADLTTPDDVGAADVVRQLAQQLLPRLEADTSAVAKVLDARLAPGALTDLLSAMLLEQPLSRQAMLDERRVAVRLEQLTDVLTRALLQLATPADDGSQLN